MNPFLGQTREKTFEALELRNRPKYFFGKAWRFEIWLKAKFFPPCLKAPSSKLEFSRASAQNFGG
jgi:hypothetical protein